MTRKHYELRAWQLSMQLVKDIYQLTSIFPSDEKFGLTNQMRRAAVSIPSNISEGAARQSNKEFIQFLYIAHGSAAELETQLIVAKNLRFLDDKAFDLLNKERDEIGRMLFGLIKYRQKL